MRCLACLVVLSIGCAVPGCSSPQTSDTPPPAPRQPANPAEPDEPRPTIVGVWRVTGIDAGGATLKAPALNEPIAIEFAGVEGTKARVSGFAGVNRFSGTYSFSLGEMNTGGLWVNGLVATRRGGPEELMRFEATLLDVLERARTFTFDGRNGTVDSGADRIRLVR
jgi:heat shock protein HslJ